MILNSHHNGKSKISLTEFGKITHPSFTGDCALFTRLDTSRDRLSGYEFTSTGSVIQTQYDPPARTRGELFNQPRRINYVFGEDIYPIPLSLSVFHEQRLIVIAVDVAALSSIYAEHPALNSVKKEFATKLLTKLRRKYDGTWSEVKRIAAREHRRFFVEGPFIPYEQGIAVVSLTIQVTRDFSFDQAYVIARKHLELHPENQDVDRLAKRWTKPKPPIPRDPNAYQWSGTELRAVESMAPVDAGPDTFGGDRTKEERIRFNEIVWRQCQEKLRKENQAMQRENDSSEASDLLLAKWFNRV